MYTNELIGRLREEAKRYQFHPLLVLLTEAADRLEELDERISIMAADMDRDWGKNY